MKRTYKFTAAVLMACVCCICFLSASAAAYFKGSAGIDDKAGLYTTAEKTKLEKRQQEVYEHTGWNIAVVTTETGFTLDEAIDYAEDYYDEKFGYSSSGILYLIDVEYRHICISGDTDYYYFNDTRVNEMLDICEAKYQDYDDVGNLEAFYDYVENCYDEGPFENSSDDVYSSSVSGGGLKNILSNFKFYPLVGLIAAGIAIMIIVNSYKFHSKPTTTRYVDQNKTNFYNRQDIFVREYTTRTRISDNSGGSGRSGRHGSSGGSRHGGGSRGGRR